MTYETSIVVPDFNKWELTRACLKGVSDTVDKARIEVIVVDNASGDLTPKACPYQGSNLFGEGFRCIRNQRNRNFAGASNQGAEQSRGDHLLFLNNDTFVQTGWYEPLFDDISAYKDLGATGSILAYPDS